MSDLPNEIDRINALTSNARNTWFALLGVLVFVGMTLMGVEHIDFYGVNRATKLPLVDVAVPTFYFFAAAPILTAAIYGYFHLYLIRLWDALGAAESHYDGRPLGDIISPWLVTDAALQFRRWWRTDDCTTPRNLESMATLLNVFLSFGGGIVVLYLLWQGSYSARTFWMSSIAGVVFGMACITGFTSLTTMLDRMMAKPRGAIVKYWAAPSRIVTISAVLGFIVLLCHQNTQGSLKQLASLNMIDQQIVERPGNWLPYGIAKAEFRASWCRREGVENCDQLGSRQKDFQAEWWERRHATRYILNRPNLHRNRGGPPDFREAKLNSSFLAGANLWGAQMDHAQMNFAQMEGVFLNFASLKWTNFSGANMEVANFSYSHLTGWPQPKGEGQVEMPNVLQDTNLSAATNEGGALRFTSFETVIFDAQTNFRNAFLDGSVKMTPGFAAQMNNPCQWIPEPLDDAEFYAYWRWWIEKRPVRSNTPPVNWSLVAPDEWKDVPAASGDQLTKYNLENCTWKRSPMPNRGE